MCADRAFLLCVVPTNNFVVPSACQYQLGVSLAPLHGVDAFGVSPVKDGDWALLIPKIPNLELVPLLVV